MSEAEVPVWNFFTNHAHVLICLARNPEQPLREVALSVGITERAVQRIVAELEGAGYIERERVGRQNHYSIHTEGRLRHPLEAHRSIGDLLDVVVPRVAKRYEIGGHGSEI
ncbi:MAG: helix-turn-helix transcriptional regulator [Opitutales bacterium]